MNKQIDLITSLDETEAAWWEKTIQEFRNRLVKEPKVHALEIITKEGITKEQLIRDIEKSLELLREAVWQRYLLDEANFHKEIMAYLISARKLPRGILLNILENNFFDIDFNKFTKEESLERISKIVGEYTGSIMPYIYQLSLSTTQSRRARAGKVFENIIETFFDLLDYPYSNQSSLGNAAYNAQNLGKKVDLIVPSMESYLSNRPKSALITMKTTLRERWQEVAEELNRTNVPHIYLLTIDEDVTPNTVTVMKQYNITLVLYKRSKDKKFADFSNVMDYETFFLREMPHILSYWV